jgi:hypothetical protein
MEIQKALLGASFEEIQYSFAKSGSGSKGRLGEEELVSGPTNEEMYFTLRMGEPCVNVCFSMLVQIPCCRRQ